MRLPRTPVTRSGLCCCKLLSGKCQPLKERGPQSIQYTRVVCLHVCMRERERHRTFSSPEDSNAALARELAEHGADGAASPALLHNECLGGLLWWGEGGEVGGHGLGPGDGVGEETGLARGEVLGGHDATRCRYGNVIMPDRCNSHDIMRYAM